MKANELEIPTGSLLPGFSSVDIMQQSATEQFGLHIPATVHNTWHSVMSAVTYLDAIADGDYGQDDELDVQAIVTYLHGITDNPPQFINPNATDSLIGLRQNFDDTQLEAHHRTEFAEHAMALALLNVDTPADESVQALTEHRLALGRYFGQLFIDTVPNAYRTKGFELFAEWMRHVGACSEVADSIWDLPEDYRTGKTAVVPSLKNRALLGYYALPEATRVTAGITPKIAGRLAVKAVLFGVNRSGKFNKYRTR